MSMRHICLMLAVLGLLMAAGPAQAVDYATWLNGGADYGAGANWSLGSLPSGNYAAVGVSGGSFNSATLTSNVSASIPSYLTIGYDTTGSLTATAPFNLSVGTAFYVGGGTSSVGNGTLNIGTLGSTDGTITTSIFDAGYSTGSTGAIIQNGGLVQLIGTSTGYLALGGGSLSGFSSNSTGMAGTGSYTLNGGTLTSACSPNRGTFMIGCATGGTGTFDQYGGLVQSTASGPMDIGYCGNGFYNLHNGTIGLGGGRLYVGFFGDGAFNQTGGSVSCFVLSVGLGTVTTSGAGVFSISAGTLTATNQIVTGEIGNNHGTINISGTGLVQVTGQCFSVCNDLGSNQTGALNMSGGSLTVVGNSSDGFYVARGPGSYATVNQTGGGIAVTASNIKIGANASSTGFWTISGGTLNQTTASYSLYVGYAGLGSLTVTGTATTPGSGGYDLSTGYVATAGTLVVSNSSYAGTVYQDAGRVDVAQNVCIANSGGAGTYTINGGLLNQTGSSYNLYVANSTGTGTLNVGGTITNGVAATGSVSVAGSMYVGGQSTAGVGIVNQSAGSLAVAGTTYVGNTGVGVYNLSGGVMNPTTLIINSTGTYNQSGGVLNMVSDFTGSSGAYNLSGGQLAMNAHNISGVTSFGFSGGTITDAATVNSSIMLASGTGAVFQQSGTATTTTVSGAISGNGQLIQAGLGTLDLTGSAMLNYSGTTTIASGTLKAAYASLGALASAPVNVQTSASKFLINYTGTAQSTADATVQSILAASYNSGGGHFASGTIYSPTATAAAKALGWNDNNSNQITVAYTVYGDANLDGAVNGADLGAVLANFGSTNGTWYMGDFNYDGSVNGADLGVVLANFGQHISVTAAVPEPSTLLLSAAGLVGLLAYAWRKRK